MMKKWAAVILASTFAMSGVAFAGAHMAGEKPKNPCAAKEMKDEKKDMKKEMKDEKKDEKKAEKKM